jgi:hypothetical protein
MELYYVLVQNAAPPPRHVLCERVAAAGGFWLYKYIPRYDMYIDDGYAEDLGRLKLIIAERYGWFEETFLIKGFENTARLFELRAYPRVIYLTPQETFCTRISGEVFASELRGNKVEYVKKWIDGATEPKSLQEALREAQRICTEEPMPGSSSNTTQRRICVSGLPEPLTHLFSARERGSVRLPKKYVSRRRHPSFK